MKRMNFKQSGFARAVEEILDTDELETTKAIDNVEAVTSGDPAQVAEGQTADAEQKERLEAEAAATAAAGGDPAGDPVDTPPGDPLATDDPAADPAADPSADPAADPSTTEDPAAVTQDPTTPDASGTDAEQALTEQASAEVKDQIAEADANPQLPSDDEASFAAETMEQLTGTVDALSDAADLHSDLCEAKSTIEQSIPVGGFKPTDIEAVSASINALLTPVELGVPEEFGVGAEAFAPSRRIKSTQRAAESLGKIAEQVKQAILNFLKKIQQWIKELVKHIAAAVSNSGKKVKLLTTDLEATTGEPAPSTEKKVPVHLAGNFSVNGEAPNVLGALAAQASSIAFFNTFIKQTFTTFDNAVKAIMDSGSADPYQVAYEHLNPSKLFVGWEHSKTVEGQPTDDTLEYWVAKDVHFAGNKKLAAKAKVAGNPEAFIDGLKSLSTFILILKENGEGLDWATTKEGAQLLLNKYSEQNELIQVVAQTLAVLEKREEQLNRLVEHSVNSQTKQEPDVAHPSVTPSGHSSYEKALYNALVALHGVVISATNKFLVNHYYFETALSTYIEHSIKLMPKKSNNPDQRAADDKNK